MTLREAVRLLSDAGVPEPLSEARALFSHFAGIPIAHQLFGEPSSDAAALLDAVGRRAAREPLAYIVGAWGFYRESYLLSPDCLIPREDTELLVDTAVSLLPRGAHFADLCTGCGCVGLSVLNNTEETTALLLDISAGAVDTARKNAERLGLSRRAELLVADVTERAVGTRYDAVLSNPPYIKNAVYPSLSPEVKKEPVRALLGGEDGMDFYRSILSLYRDRLTENGFFAFEIGFDEAEDIARLATRHALSCEIRRDLSGNPRVALLRPTAAGV